MKKAGRFFLFIIVVITLIATFKFLWDSSHPETSVYEIIFPKMGNIDNVTTVTGNIEPRNETSVKPEISGTIKQIIKKIGDNVREGDVIATLNIIPDAAQTSAAQSRLQQANITLNLASKVYERQKGLFETHAIPKNEYEASEAQYHSAIEEKENAQEALDIAKTGFSRRSNLIDNTKVRSSASGTILDIPIKTGNKVIHTNPFSEGTTIAVVANMRDLIFRGTIDESEIGKIWEGMPASISVGAVADETIDATLEYIAPQGKKESGSILFEIKAALNMPKTMTSLMRAHYSANANIIIEQVKNVIKIPESSVEFNKDGSTYVYVLQPGTGAPKNQIFIKRKIEIGLYDGNFVEVKSGLEFNDRIRGMRVDTKSK